MTETDQAAALSPEDRKLATLARATRARTRAAEGAAVRDLDGRTYAGATIDLPHLRISAIAVCIAMAVSSGSRGLDTLVLLTDVGPEPAPTDVEALADIGGATVLINP